MQRMVWWRDGPYKIVAFCLKANVRSLIMEKILVGIIANRLLKAAENERALSDVQFGFRKGNSTVSVMNMTVDCRG